MYIDGRSSGAVERSAEYSPQSNYQTAPGGTTKDILAPRHSNTIDQQHERVQSFTNSAIGGISVKPPYHPPLGRLRNTSG